MDPAAELACVARRAEEIVAAKGRLQLAVSRARRAGCSWAEIGNTLGISRQAAFERFNTEV